ncbi:tail fiber protein [Candidatus Wolfebacteria bacterium]|nr:tail fiber protein [Candidatus Wolfebacteria bacterium]
MKNLNKINLIQLSIFVAVLIGMATITVKGAPGPWDVPRGGTGTSTIPSAGQFLIGNGADYSLSTLIPGLGITVSNSAGSVSIANNGVLSLLGTSNQVNVSSATGTITLSLPQNVATSSNPTFSGLSLIGGGITFADSTTQTSAAPAGIPVGTIVSYASTTAPAGWLLADGNAVSRTTYSNLFGLIGIRYGAGDGSTTFNLPNFILPLGTNFGLVSNWNMDETSGTTVADSSGNNNGGTATGTIIVTGKFGNARNFNSTSDYVLTTNDFDWNTLTVSAWVKFNAFNQDTWIIAKSNRPWTTFSDSEFLLGLEGGGTVLKWDVVDTAEHKATYATSNFTIGTWYYIVGVADDTNNVLRLYINGTEVASYTQAFSHNNITAPLFFGSHASANGADAVIDEVRVYNRVLSPTEIQNLYHAEDSYINIIKY